MSQYILTDFIRFQVSKSPGNKKISKWSKPKNLKKIYWETLTVNHDERDHNRLIVSFQSGATENRTGQN